MGQAENLFHLLVDDLLEFVLRFFDPVQYRCRAAILSKWR